MSDDNNAAPVDREASAPVEPITAAHLGRQVVCETPEGISFIGTLVTYAFDKGEISYGIVLPGTGDVWYAKPGAGEIVTLVDDPNEDVQIALDHLEVIASSLANVASNLAKIIDIATQTLPQPPPDDAGVELHSEPPDPAETATGFSPSR